MKRVFLTLTLLFVFVITSNASFGQESVMLKYNFKEGKSFKTTMNLTNEMVQSMMGQEMKATSTVGTVSEYKISKVDAKNNATALVTILDLSATTVAMGKEDVVKKSDFKKENICAEYDQTGKSISGKLIDTTEDFSKVGSFQGFVKLQILPAREVKVGEVWNEKQIDTVNNGPSNPMSFMTTAMDTEYTLVGKEMREGKNVYKISYKSSMELAGKGKQMNMDLFLEGTGEVTGFFYFDPAASVTVYSEGNTEMNSTITVTGQQNMSIPMTQKVKVVSTTVEL
ncbi:MAG: hypothetical protein HGA52_07830 [Bacteroidales bacterium]|nr:hypothetical protein [Bacteroidales bacterium]